MLNLTQKAADRFGIEYRNLEPRQGDFWRVDIVILNRLKFLLCVHEPTLFTHLLPARDFKTTDAVIGFLKESHPELNVSSVLGRGFNRRVTGSVNEMKFHLSVYIRIGTPEEDLERRINYGIYNYLECKRPQKAWELYREGNKFGKKP